MIDFGWRERRIFLKREEKPNWLWICATAAVLLFLGAVGVFP